MRPAKSFVVRVAVYSAALLYLAGDLLIFGGPVSRRVEAARPDSEAAIAHAKGRGVVARVFGHPIYLSQVERAARERLWLEGRDIADLEPERRREVRTAALNDLVDHQLLRVKIRHNSGDVPVTEEEIDAAVERLASRFATREEMRRMLEAEKIDSEKELRMRLGGRLQQEKFLETRIAEDVEVTGEEVRSWYEANAGSLELPLRVRARHVFLATLDREPDEAEKRLREALERLEAGEADFESLAAELSEDPRTSGHGGDLGWVTEARLPADFGKPLFAMEAGEPRLLRTKIGWHLVEVVERREAEAREFGEVRAEITAALESARRRDMVREFRKELRAMEADSVQIFPDMIPTE